MFIFELFSVEIVILGWADSRFKSVGRLTFSRNSLSSPVASGFVRSVYQESAAAWLPVADFDSVALASLLFACLWSKLAAGLTQVVTQVGLSSMKFQGKVDS